jgi:NADP-dependent 3-hydroxy acid dehydrogenase YdfG
MARNWKGEHIWLIGASHGIGEALAHKMIEAGAYVSVSGRSTTALEALAQRAPDRVQAVVCDVTDAASLQHAYEHAQSFRPITMMLYNAGSYEPMSSRDFDLAQVEAMINVNLLGAVRAVHHVLPDMVARNVGAIALVGSVAGYRGLPRAMGYGLSKAALIHMAENLRIDLSGTAITTHIINPGFVKTRLTDKNHFTMPCMITADRAATYIMEGLNRGDYEIHFPKRFTWLLKALGLLPHRAYFVVANRL